MTDRGSNLQRKGLLLRKAGDFVAAELCLRESLALAPENYRYYNNLATLLGQQGRHAEAAWLCRKAIDLEPSYARAHANLALSLLNIGRFDEAEGEAGTAIALQHDLSDAHVALGACLAARGKLLAAMDVFVVALELCPQNRDAVIYLTTLLGSVGRQNVAVDILGRFLDGVPNDPVLRANLLYDLHHIHGNDGPLLRNAHEQWAQMHAEPFRTRVSPHANDRNCNRRLRICYVSADFRDHPAARFLIPLLDAHDADQVEVFLYNDTFASDNLTDRGKATVAVARDTAVLSAEAFARQVRDDLIDVLIEPTGHMAHNRLLALARHPAPVQISYFGYPGTLAMTAIEYRITDVLLDPPGWTESHYTERLLRIAPSAMAWGPLTWAPNVEAKSPMTSNGFVTFGALNRLSKTTPEMISLWARILAAAPESRLMILSPATDEPKVHQEIRRLFALQGVPADRVDVAHRAPREKYLELFNHIDVHLDTFPYHGCTTTCDALWMGVPTVTLLGRAYASRMGVSLLTQVGLTDFIADTPDLYVEIATRVARDPQRLTDLRRTMRDRMQHSPLMDYKRLTRNIEAAYRYAWNLWCNDQDPRTIDRAPIFDG